MTAHRANHVGAGTAYRAREDEYVRLRRSGCSAVGAAERMGLAERVAETMESHFKAQTMLVTGTDATVPKFAENTKHVAAVMRLGGYRDWPRIGRLPDGRTVLVHP